MSLNYQGGKQPLESILSNFGKIKILLGKARSILSEDKKNPTAYLPVFSSVQTDL
jgi:hypothetical protein